MFKYCPQCGHALQSKFIDNRQRQVCTHCSYVCYQNPVPAAATLVIKDKRVLLIKRRFPPQAGKWSLPSGFVELDESPMQAAVRETKEETGLTVQIKELLDVVGTCAHSDAQIVLILYRAIITSGTLKAADDAQEAAFFHLDNLPDNIAFSIHRRIIDQFA